MQEEQPRQLCSSIFFYLKSVGVSFSHRRKKQGRKETAKGGEEETYRKRERERERKKLELGYIFRDRLSL